jgi:hypothetical protein
MIYCVVPEALAEELYDKLTSYYAEDDNVKVIIDRRREERRRTSEEDDKGQRQVRDRRRARVPGEFPAIDEPAR